ncbi:thioredoxin-dependent thiol peroxidase [Paeniglutamicibacter kerguelensis]|uniref:thioredoxin-dependent thiol peroxidase n=1 Tax=Paeniglutamicibacter kerguelensis TaxID=254788 RepID=UPI001AE379E2|nr:thioredoxin-dependent thiol peroxidase [Paeniglutamicibacter kerguelensis]
MEFFVSDLSTPLTVGERAPEFSLADARGNKISLSDYAGKNVVVYFYPKAATPGCTTEACDFRDNLNSLRSAGYEVLGISPDQGEALASFAEAESLNFPLLSDPDLAVTKAYGSFGEKEVNGNQVEGLLRSTVVVGPDGRVTLAEYKVAASGHVARLREELGV